MFAQRVARITRVQSAAVAASRTHSLPLPPPPAVAAHSFHALSHAARPATPAQRHSTQQLCRGAVHRSCACTCACVSLSTAAVLPPRTAPLRALHSSAAVHAASEPPHTPQPQPIIYTHKIPKKKSNFRDRARVHVSGGRGGAGCSSYDTDPYGKGGPDGANGGRGGDVYLVSTDQLSAFSLETFHLRGQNGQSGRSGLSKGRNGYSLKVPIPAGTIVSEILATDPEQGEYKLKLLADMDRSGLEIKVATGGAGGLGNRAFKTKYRKQARFSTMGEYGTARWLYLELKCIADVGLVGYPNAGKSSFLAAISNATPEIANYPFTTLHPQVGVVEEGDLPLLEDGGKGKKNKNAAAAPAASVDVLGAPLTHGSSRMTRLHVADLPGLISGAASHNRGLGHEFLKHIQRTKVLCYVLDLSGNDGRDPVQDFLSLQQELYTFDPELINKPALILANKIDNVAQTKRSVMEAKIKELASVTTLPVLPASCLKKTGLQPVVTQLFQLVREQEEAEHMHRQQTMMEEVEKERKVQEMMEEEKREMEREAEENVLQAEPPMQMEQASSDAQPQSPTSSSEAASTPTTKSTGKKEKKEKKSASKKKTKQKADE